MVIGHATHAGVKKKKSKDGKKYIYSKNKGKGTHWTYVIRAKDPKKAEKLARCMEKAIENNKYIGYSNNGKTSYSMYTKLKDHNFDPDYLTRWNKARKKKGKKAKKVHINCCNLISVCLNYAGIKTKACLCSYKLNKQLGKKKKLTVFKFKPKKTKLKRGDILVSTTMPSPHTALVLKF